MMLHKWKSLKIRIETPETFISHHKNDKFATVLLKGTPTANQFALLWLTFPLFMYLNSKQLVWISKGEN